MRVSNRTPLLALVACTAVLCAAATSAQEDRAPLVVRARLADAIHPITAEYVVQAVADAEQRNADLFVLEIDTPGGLDSAMRDMIKGVLASRIPVVAYVAPGGARAASAGTYLLYATHVAAMAPGERGEPAASLIPIAKPATTFPAHSAWI